MNRRPRRSLRDIAAILVTIVATMIAFAPTITSDFTSWDDYETVARNPLMNPPTARSIETFWTRPHGDLYIPVTYTAWAAIAAAPNSRDLANAIATDPWPPRLRAHGFHFMNVVFHVAAAMLVYGVLEMLVKNRAAALIGALLFALHPVQVESVAWVSGMKDVLFGMLSLAAIYEYLKSVDEPRMSLRRVHYIVATTAFILAMLAKPTAMVVPLVVIVLDHVVLDRPVKTVLKAAWPWLLLALPCAIAAKMIQPAPHASDAAAPLWARPLIAADALAFYLYKLVWPAKLGFDYGRTPAYVRNSGMIAWTWIVPVIAVAIAWWSWRRRRREWAGRTIAAALAIMVIVLLPVLGLVPFDFQTYSTVADHYLYLAMLGPALIVAWLVSRRASRVAIVIAALLITVLSVRTFAQTRHWHDSRALFTHGLQVNPRSFAAYSHLASMANEVNQPDQAIALIRQALDIRPDAARYSIYAEALRRKGQTNDAIVAYREALRQDDAYPAALANLAVMLAEQGRLDEAIPLARQAVQVEPHSAQNRFNLALMYLHSNQPAPAREQLEAVLRIDPHHAGARQLLNP